MSDNLYHIRISRRHAHKLALSIAGLAMLPLSAAAQAAPDKANQGKSADTMRKVTFRNHLGIDLAGNIHLPAGFDESRKYAAIVTVSPASGVKEQTSGLYAQKLSAEGFVTIAFDPSFQGESGGAPRHQESPITRVEDVRGAVDLLVSLPYVDENRIGVLGICAGGGYAASAAMTERRIKAVGLAVPVNGGREMRATGPEATIAALEEIAKLRSAEARGEEPMLMPWFPDEAAQSDDIDQREGYDYYRTLRAQNPNWQNKGRFAAMDAVMGFDAFHLADTLLTQPLQIIVGSKPGSFGSNKDGHELHRIAASKQKDIVVMEGASHFDLYDRPQYVDPAVARFTAFYRSNLD